MIEKSTIHEFFLPRLNTPQRRCELTMINLVLNEIQLFMKINGQKFFKMIKNTKFATLLEKRKFYFITYYKPTSNEKS